ncbi:hypothetical protein TRFO_36663 [Tritrichomonas foetus]|uniref:VPS9 domain-containing protein n=1 Tax=Tritrichomonas foetus TaxID=1144522 RepID=A0A1J4JD97_9EUKA|nr:hypothetical protein TRFO_36663 [Tritrichomonas foetus]|eukprot:OHS97174.1 hypothetical protein TRFO_36663 [Tritrichomonas foetus]
MNLSELPITKWLINNPAFVQFFDFEVKDEETEDQLFSLIGSLTHYYNFNLLPYRPEKPQFSHLDRSMMNDQIFQAHIHFFIQNLIYKNQIQSHKKAVDTLNDLIESLVETMKIKPNCPITCAQNSLFHLLNIDSPKTNSLITKDNDILLFLSHNEIDEYESQSDFMEETILNMRTFVMPKAVYFPVNSFQESFNQIIFSPSFFAYDRVEDILSDQSIKEKETFSIRCVKLMQFIVTSMEIKEPENVLIFSTSFFRSIFDAAYESHHELFDLPEKSTILEYTSRITMKMTGADIKFLPGYSQSDTFLDIIKKHQNLKSASSELMIASFSNSPLDILGHVHFALNHVRIYVSEIDPEMIQSFDVIFGIFLIVFLGTELPNPELLFYLVDVYTPHKGLSGALEYASSTLTATRIQCNDIIRKIKESEQE